MSEDFAIRWPGDVLFGVGRAETLGDELVRRGHRRALIVSDPGLKAAGLLARIEASLDRAGVAHAAYAEVRPNPTVANVDAAFDLWSRGGFDALVALGGGSAMDTAKSVLARVITGMTMDDVVTLDLDATTTPCPPFYCLPTTSGTGSESSLGAVVKGKARKYVFRTTRTRPSLVIMDPALTLTLPARATAMSGFDAYCHALGALTNNVCNPVIDELALQAMRLLLEWLQKAVADGSDLRAREAVMLGSYLAGVAIGQKGVDGIHGLSTAAESHADNPVHAEVLGVIMPHVMAFNLETHAALYARAARRLGLARDGSVDAEAASALVAASMALQSVTGGVDRLSKLGVSPASIPQMVEIALATQPTGRNVRPMTARDIAALYEAVI